MVFYRVIRFSSVRFPFSSFLVSTVYLLYVLYDLDLSLCSHYLYLHLLDLYD